MNVNITTEVKKVIENDSCKVTMLNGAITSIKVERAGYTGEIDFESNFVGFEEFLHNCCDVYYSVAQEAGIVLERIDVKVSGGSL